MISVEEEDHQVAPLITRPAPSSRQTGTDRECIPSQQRDIHLLPLSKHCTAARWLLAPALAGAQFILHHIFQFDVNSQFIPARSLVWSGAGTLLCAQPTIKKHGETGALIVKRDCEHTLL